MSERNRNTLKRRFGDGVMPSATDFGDLIDSVLNIKDDGILHTRDDGLRLTQVRDSSRVLSLYSGSEEQNTIWAFRLDERSDSLTLDARCRDDGRDHLPQKDDDRQGGGYAVLTLLAPPDGAQDARVGINTRHPRHALEVDGVVASSGRSGAPGTLAPLADAGWHTIGGPYRGCTALEVMAGVGEVGEGKYALMHAFALRTFDAAGEITYHQAHYGSRRHRMELRWNDLQDGSDGYELQVRVRCAYGRGTRIRYALTTLWFDAEMKDCAGGAVHGVQA